MKNIAMKIMLVAVMVALAGVVMSGSALASAGITGSKHDFKGETSWNPSGEICNVCHTPHNADATFTAVPLWDHTTTTATTFSFYDSGTMDATDPTSVSDISKACLSCHDGTVAVDAFGASPTSNLYLASGDDGYIGTDLSNDHPISFSYQSSIDNGDGGLKAATAGGAVDDLLMSGKVECSSCHDVHDNTNAPFLVMSNSGSALCLTCHNK